MTTQTTLGAPLRATALFETGDVPCVVVGVSSIGLEVRLEGHARLQESLRLVFEHEGPHGGSVRALCAVDGRRESDAGEVLYLRLIALHSVDGVLCLTGFLQDGLGVDRVNTAAFREGAGGWFYSFKARWKSEAPADTPGGGGEDVEQKRREARIAVRDEVTLVVAGEQHGARAYNISRGGVYVLVETVLPAVGVHLTVMYEIPFAGGTVQARLQGEVVWSMASMDSATSGGIGVVLESIEDGADGQAWIAYVESEADFGESIPLKE
ncbi:MAG: hypothetical protein CL940_12705 [Deltaproteobacteria bacterium]|nr:hypothetical protein [Deltaproteobacteria bacterium]